MKKEEVLELNEEIEKVKILSIADILAKKEDCLKRKGTQYIYVYSEFLGGALKAHSLNKIDANDVRTRTKEDVEKGVKYFIYMSIDDLREKTLLEGYGCIKGKELGIVDALFSEAEIVTISDDLSKLNGWSNFSETAIMTYEVNELEGE